MKIAVVGAGVVGSTVAVQLAQQGHAVTLIERRPALDSGVALTLHGVAVDVLHGIGVHLTGAHTSRLVVEDWSGRTLGAIDSTDSGALLTTSHGRLLGAIHSVFPSTVNLVRGVEITKVTHKYSHTVVQNDHHKWDFDGAIVAAGSSSRSITLPGRQLRQSTGYKVARAVVPRNELLSYGERWGPGVRTGRLPLDATGDYIWMTVSQTLLPLLESVRSQASDFDADLAQLEDFHGTYILQPPTRYEIHRNPIPLIGDSYMAIPPEGGLGVTRGLASARRFSSLLTRTENTHQDFTRAAQQFMISERQVDKHLFWLTRIIAHSHANPSFTLDYLRSRGVQAFGDAGLQAAWNLLTHSHRSQLPGDRTPHDE